MATKQDRKNNVMFTMWLDAKMRKEVEIAAKEEFRTSSAFVRHAIDKYLRERKKDE